MAWRIGRTLPPAAAPLVFTDILYGVAASIAGRDVVKSLEVDLGKHFGSKYCFGLSSGKAALAIIIDSLHELSKDRNELLLPAYTCYSVPSAVVRSGIKFRLCDLGQGSLDFDFNLLNTIVNSKHLLAIVCTHLYSLSADVSQTKKQVREQGVYIIEDAAQVMGEGKNCKEIGHYGDVFFFSSSRGKTITTGHGGFVLTNDDEIGQQLEKRILSFPSKIISGTLKATFQALAILLFLHPHLFWIPKQIPFLNLGCTKFEPSFGISKLSPFQAGLARGWKNKLLSSNCKRSSNAIRLSSSLSSTIAIQTRICNVLRFPVLMESIEMKNKILKESEIKGLGISQGYQHTVATIFNAKNISYGETFPVAESISERAILLPTHGYVKETDIFKTTELINRFLPQ